MRNRRYVAIAIFVLFMFCVLILQNLKIRKDASPIFKFKRRLDRFSVGEFCLVENQASEILDRSFIEDNP